MQRTYGWYEDPEYGTSRQCIYFGHCVDCYDWNDDEPGEIWYEGEV